MPTEPDQTRWVGIRPTPNCGDIPVDAVRPAGTVSDLQALNILVGLQYVEFNKDCSVSYAKNSTAVGANLKWVITNISLENETSMCDMFIAAKRGAASRLIKAFYSIPPNIICTWDGLIILGTTDLIISTFKLGGVTDDINVWINGYQIGVY